ncbi:Hypothetical predicted protein [Pelobates cultripes]|uniref:Uncharacterized protein n=1 Tax=Pelobates cultripes TaxID=61616 RepID=A0AAD1WSS7_PELCU|nr:Hypothetical predicted protein [Pelobates cultripes]
MLDSQHYVNLAPSHPSEAPTTTATLQPHGTIILWHQPQVFYKMAEAVHQATFSREAAEFPSSQDEIFLELWQKRLKHTFNSLCVKLAVRLQPLTPSVLAAHTPQGYTLETEKGEKCSGVLFRSSMTSWLPTGIQHGRAMSYPRGA